MSKGFAPRQARFCLRIQAENVTYPIEFLVNDEGKWPSIARAKRTAIAKIAIAQYGTEADGYAAICEEFGDEYVSQLLGIHEQLKGQKFIGKLRNSQKLLVVTCASHPGMIEDEHTYNSEEAIQQLKA